MLEISEPWIWEEALEILFKTRFYNYYSALVSTREW